MSNLRKVAAVQTARTYPEILDSSLKLSEELFNQHIEWWSSI